MRYSSPPSIGSKREILELNLRRLLLNISHAHWQAMLSSGSRAMDLNMLLIKLEKYVARTTKLRNLL